MDSDDAPSASELPAVTGRVKWFDATRGFGFVVCDGLDGDVLLHFSVLREHGRRSVPEAAIAAAVLVACSPQAPAKNMPAEQRAQTGLKQVPLTIRSRNGVHRFTVAVARTPEQQERGLMFVRFLAPNRGMIFPYDPPQQVAFWMKNTLIPLDIIFIRADGRIARIANAKPLDETPLPSGEPAAAVLEIAGGRAAQLGIKAGDRVEWPH